MFDHADIKLATKLLKYWQSQVYLHVLLCRWNYSANERATHKKHLYFLSRVNINENWGRKTQAGNASLTLHAVLHSLAIHQHCTVWLYKQHCIVWFYTQHCMFGFTHNTI